MTGAGDERQLFDQAPDAIVFADRDGIIRAWNPAATALFGHAPEQALGQSLDLIVPEKFRAAHWQGYQRALAAGQTQYRGKALPTRSMRSDGTEIYVELTFAIVRDAAGAAIGALAHARDISERWARERSQRQRLRELERQVGPARG
jgi:PAS domain S-box-containing protein